MSGATQGPRDRTLRPAVVYDGMRSKPADRPSWAAVSAARCRIPGPEVSSSPCSSVSCARSPSAGPWRLPPCPGPSRLRRHSPRRRPRRPRPTMSRRRDLAHARWRTIPTARSAPCCATALPCPQVLPPRSGAGWQVRGPRPPGTRPPVRPVIVPAAREPHPLPDGRARRARSVLAQAWALASGERRPYRSNTT